MEELGTRNKDTWLGDGHWGLTVYSERVPTLRLA
jgi:hypothetical protein